MVPNIYVLVMLGLVALGAALGMLLSRNTVYAALFLVLNFATVAFLYLILGAPFIALVQITVYAGSIMVLFLFVIMLLGTEKLSGEEPLRGHRLAATVLGLAFLIELVMFILFRANITQVIPAPGVDSGSPMAIGTALFDQYSLPFEITGFLLLVATVGAILLTRADKVPTRKLFDARRLESPSVEPEVEEEKAVSGA